MLKLARKARHNCPFVSKYVKVLSPKFWFLVLEKYCNLYFFVRHILFFFGLNGPFQDGQIPKNAVLASNFCRWFSVFFIKKYKKPENYNSLFEIGPFRASLSKHHNKNNRAILKIFNWFTNFFATKDPRDFVKLDWSSETRWKFWENRLKNGKCPQLLHCQWFRTIISQKNNNPQIASVIRYIHTEKRFQWRVWWPKSEKYVLRKTALKTAKLANVLWDYWKFCQGKAKNTKAQLTKCIFL